MLAGERKRYTARWAHRAWIRIHDSRHSAMASPYSANERFRGDAAHASQPEKNSDLLRWSRSCPPLRGGRGALGV